MSPPKATPDAKQRGIASFFGGGGGAGGVGASAAKKEATKMEATKKASTAEADAAATVVDAKQLQSAAAGKKEGGEADIIMVESLDSDVKREVRKEEAREMSRERERAT